MRAAAWRARWFLVPFLLVLAAGAALALAARGVAGAPPGYTAF